MFLNLFMFVTFVVFVVTFFLTIINWNLSLLACEKKLKDFSLFQKNFGNPQIHSASHDFSLTKPKTHAIWMRKDSLSWVLFSYPWFNSFNYLWTFFLSVFGCFVFNLFFLLKKIQKHWKFSKRLKYFILFIVLFFLRIIWIIISVSWLRTCLILWKNIESMCCIIECMSHF